MLESLSFILNSLFYSCHIPRELQWFDGGHRNRAVALVLALRCPHLRSVFLVLSRSRYRSTFALGVAAQSANTIHSCSTTLFCAQSPALAKSRERDRSLAVLRSALRFLTNP